MTYIPHNNLDRGGIADSPFSGVPNSVARMVGIDIHTVSGIIQANQRMTKISGDTITEKCMVGLAASNNIRYWFSNVSGKIWQEKDGAFDLVYTTTPSAGEDDCLGAIEHDGYIYWFTSHRVHRIPVANADGASAWTANVQPNFGNFLKGDYNFHPCRIVNLVLYIGDGNVVAQVDSGVFSDNALDIDAPHRVSALGKMGTDLLIGTYIADNVAHANIYRWNTWGTSFSNHDMVYEPGIFAFLETDNYVQVCAGYAGNIYNYDGDKLSYFKTIPGNYSNTAGVKVNPYAIGMYRGMLPIFGVSQWGENAGDCGIWSLGRSSYNHGIVLNLEFPTSNVDSDEYPILTDLTIGAIVVAGNDIYASWSYGGENGVDKLDYTQKIKRPFLETKVMKPDMSQLNSFKDFYAHYVELPEDTNIIIKKKENHNPDGFGEPLETVNDSDRMFVNAPSESTETKVMQMRIELETSDNKSPIIEDFGPDVS